MQETETDLCCELEPKMDRHGSGMAIVTSEIKRSHLSQIELFIINRLIMHSIWLGILFEVTLVYLDRLVTLRRRSNGFGIIAC